MLDPTLRRLRSKAAELLLEFEATVHLITPPNRRSRAELDTQRDSIQSKSKSDLRRLISHLRLRIQQVRREWGVKASARELLGIYAWMQSTPPKYLPLIPLYVHRSLFENYDRIYPSASRMPPHARLGLDIRGEFYDKSRQLEIYFLEAIFFEDVAALYNLAHSVHQEIQREKSPKAKIKAAGALTRAGMVATINFVEAYINGVAFDFLVSHNWNVDEKTKAILCEWDFSKNRPKFLSLRDKLIQYQRIALSTQHAPIQESNCAPMSQILDIAKTFRDAIAHPTPAISVETSTAEKETAVLEVRFETLTQSVDAAIGLVRRLESVLYSNEERITWLDDRNADGYFDDKTFA